MANSHRTESDLKYFFSAYFHNYWPAESDGNWESQVAAFVAKNPAATVTGAQQELAALLKDEDGEGALRKIVTRKLGANIYPPGMDMTYRGWLEAVAVKLAKQK